MPKIRKVKKNKSNSKGNAKSNIEVNNQFKYIILFAFGLLLFFVVLIKGESLWQFLHNTVFGLFGFLSFFLGISTMFVSILLSSMVIKKNAKPKIKQFLALFIFLCAQIQTYSFEEEAGVNLISSIIKAFKYGYLEYSGGGACGEIISLILRKFLGKNAAIVFIWIVVLVLVLILTGTTVFGFFKILCKPVKKVENKIKNFKVPGRFNIDVPLKESDFSEEKENENEQDEKIDVSDNLEFFKKKNNSENFETPITNNEEKKKYLDDSNKKNNYEDLKEIKNVEFNGYKFPPLGLLNEAHSSINSDVSSELRANAARLVETLQSFGVETRITDICRGPAVTRYELQPSAGVKISKITNLADDISLNLASGGVRIEAPVPNKAVVGIEVPNKKKEVVFLKEVISSKEFKNSKSKLTFALGKDIAGNVKIADISKMPHILIAGATGSGKSVCVNSLIVSLLYKSSPNDVKLVMIDPKVVELGVYNGIPHLLVPVVTDPKKAAGTLSWAVAEMMKRYKLFAETGVREIKTFNMVAESGRKNEEGENYEKLPQIVIIIDELADLMMAALSRDVENSICRLAQMARAAGMHLVIATQRPSVDVITGLIKANIPSRIAFTVSSQVDSRTILDVAGAEKLLGKGDMLYHPMEEQKPIRVQGCFLTDKEIEEIVNFLKQEKTNVYNEEIIEEIEKYSVKKDKSSKDYDENFDDKDPMLFKAMEVVVETGQASTSYLQRRLKLGYSRAARIMDELEALKVVGPQTKGKPREILMTKEEFLQMNLNKG